MTPERIAALIGAVILLVMVISIAFKFAPRRVKQSKFQRKWKELQAYCANKDTWPRALLDADKLLDEALKRRKYKGKSMGERLVAAQRTFTDNDGVWFGHKLSKKVVDHPDMKLKENEVKEALIGIRQALKDLKVL